MHSAYNVDSVEVAHGIAAGWGSSCVALDLRVGCRHEGRVHVCVHPHLHLSALTAAQESHPGFLEIHFPFSGGLAGRV